MKKSLIAGAGIAALGLAVVPFAGVFAATTPVEVKDTVTLTVSESCTFSVGGSAIAPSATVGAGEAANFGDSATHAFTIKCNSNKYEVTAEATDLTLQDAPAGLAHTTISYTGNSAYDAAAAATTKGDDGVWTAALTNGDSDAAISKTSSTIKSGKATTTDNFSVTYKALAGAAQNQGTYKGTVTYTLTGSNDAS